MSSSAPDICLDEFAFRQFDDDTYAGTKIPGISKEDFMKSVLAFYEPKYVPALPGFQTVPLTNILTVLRLY